MLTSLIWFRLLLRIQACFFEIPWGSWINESNSFIWTSCKIINRLSLWFNTEPRILYWDGTESSYQVQGCWLLYYMFLTWQCLSAYLWPTISSHYLLMSHQKEKAIFSVPCKAWTFLIKKLLHLFMMGNHEIQDGNMQVRRQLPKNQT